MSRLFGTQTTPPPGFLAEGALGDLDMTGQQQQDGDPSGQQGGEQGVPPFEGAESGNITELGDPNGQHQQQIGNPNGQQNGGDPNNGQQGDPDSESAETPGVMDAVALSVKEAALSAKEAELAAKEAQLAAGQHNGQQDANQDPEPPKSRLEGIDLESLESEGERALFKVVQELEQDLTAAQQQSEQATLDAEEIKFESQISATMEEFGVSRGELESKFKETGGLVRHLPTLAKSVLHDRQVTEKTQQGRAAGQQKQQQAQQERTQSASQISGASGAAGANRNTTENGPRGGGKINPRDGAQIAQFYGAFA